MKSVAICSLLRAGSEYERAYYLQILALSRRSFSIRSVNVIYDREPQDTAWLRELLRSQGIAVHCAIEATPERDATDLDDRARQWAASCNQCIELALSRADGLTHLAWIESDLSYPYDTMEVLLRRNRPIIAPLVYLNNIFYDSWGYRDGSGAKISSFRPVNPASGDEPVEMRSVGSFVVYDIAVFRAGIRFRGEYEHGLAVGICEDAARIGLKCFVDPSISVLHPVSAWLDQIWRCTSIQIFRDGVLQSNTLMLPDSAFAGPYEEMVRPSLDRFLQETGGAAGAGRVSIARDPVEKTFAIRVDVDSE